LNIFFSYWACPQLTVCSLAEMIGKILRHGAKGWEYLGYMGVPAVLVAAMVEAPKQEGGERFSVISGARTNSYA